MTKIFAVLATAATLSIATLAAPTTASAHCHGCYIGGGILAGALIGSAIAANSAPAYGYGPGPAYYGPPCYWTRERFWDGYGWRSRRIRVCE